MSELGKLFLKRKMTSQTEISRNWMNEWTKSSFEVVVTSYGRHKKMDENKKNIAGQVLTNNSKNFYWLNKQRDLQRPMIELEKTISIEIRSKKFQKKKQKIKIKMPQKTRSEKWKFGSNKKLGLEWTVNTLRKPNKKSDPKNRKKNSENQSEIALFDRKTTSQKANYCSNTAFSHHCKTRAKKFTPQNHSLIRSISCFRVTKITTPIWLQTSWKCVNRS